VEGQVREIVAEVRARGDAAVLELEARFGGGGPLVVAARELADALAALDPAVRAGLERGIANVEAVAVLGLGADRAATLPEGHRVALREVPVARAAIYAPGGRNPYPSSVVMGAITARAAGVGHVAVCASHPVMLAAAALCGADAVYRMGGAQAIAALAYGTESVAPADVVVGPGSLWVQEAKRQVSQTVGIDGFAGPSDLVLIAGEDADPELVGLDLAAQAEHGEGTLVVCLSPSEALLDAVDADRAPAIAVTIRADLEAALRFSEALAPEHLQLVGAEAEALAPRVTRAGALFVGAGTAFGDYVAGSNHVLPTEGAARFASGLGVRHFRRTMAEVRMPPAAAASLAAPGVAVAQAEGFGAHAASMAARKNARP